MGRLAAQKNAAGFDSDSDITLMMLPPPAHNQVGRAASNSLVGSVTTANPDNEIVSDVIMSQQSSPNQQTQLPSNYMDAEMPDADENQIVQSSTPLQEQSESVGRRGSETIVGWLQGITVGLTEENEMPSSQSNLNDAASNLTIYKTHGTTNTSSAVLNQETVDRMEITIDEQNTNIEGIDMDIEGQDEEIRKEEPIDKDKDECMKEECIEYEADDEADSEDTEKEKKYTKFADTTADREPPIDITSSTRRVLNQYRIVLDPPEQTSPPSNLLEAVEAELQASPICFQWQQFDSSIPRAGNFRMATESDLASSQLPHFFQQCFWFEKNQKGTSPVKMTSRETWKEELLKLVTQEVVFLMEWSGDDPNAGSGHDIEAGSGASGEGNYSGLILAACVVQQQGWDPTTKKATANFTNDNTEEMGANHQPFDIITLRGEFGYDEQRGLGDNPLGVRTRFQNLADSGKQPVGSGSGIYLRKTKIGAVTTDTDGNRRGINIVQSNSHLPVITAFCINPKFFGHNFGTVLLNLVTETLAAVGYRSIIGPVQHAGLDLYLTFIWTDYQRLVDENDDKQDDDSSVTLEARVYEPTELVVRGQRLYI